MHAEFAGFIQNAVDWSQAQLGRRDYAFRCLAFVEDAYEQSNGVEIFGGDSAWESAQQYAAAENLAAEPPLGAFVFYACRGPLNGVMKNWGHVGLHIGGGQVVHAWDVVRVDDYRAVQHLDAAPGWEKPVYCGWTPVERIFQGYRRRNDWLVARFWQRLSDLDFEGAGALLDEAYVGEYPQTGERICGRDNFVALNAHYPGRWQIDVLRLVTQGDWVTSEVRMINREAPGDPAVTAVSFFDVRDGRIVYERDFWPDPYPAPAWRAQWVTAMEDDSQG